MPNETQGKPQVKRLAPWLLPAQATAYLLGRCIGAVIVRAYKP